MSDTRPLSWTEMLTVAHMVSSRDAKWTLRPPENHTKNVRIAPNMILGIPLILGLGTRMSDPHVYVALWAPDTV